MTANRPPTTGYRAERGRGAQGSAQGRGEQVPTLGEDGGPAGGVGLGATLTACAQENDRDEGTHSPVRPPFPPSGQGINSRFQGRESSPGFASLAVLRKSSAGSPRRPPPGQGRSPIRPRTEGRPWGLHRLSLTCDGSAYNCLTLQGCQSDTRNKLHEPVNASLQNCSLRGFCPSGG